MYKVLIILIVILTSGSSYANITTIVSGIGIDEQELVINLITNIGSYSKSKSVDDPIKIMAGIANGKYDVAIIQQDAVTQFEENNTHLKKTWEIVTCLYRKPVFVAFRCEGDITSEMGLIDSNAKIGLDNFDNNAKITWEYMSNFYDSVEGVSDTSIDLENGILFLKEKKIDAYLWIGTKYADYVEKNSLCVKGLKDTELSDSGIYRNGWVEYDINVPFWIDDKRKLRTTEIPVVLVTGKNVSEGERKKISGLINKLKR